MSENIFNLSSYIKLLEDNKILKETNAKDSCLSTPVEYISYNSQDIKCNTLFVCKGLHFKEEFLNSAMNSGAFCYISEKKYSLDAPYILVTDIRKAMAYIADFYYNQVWKKLKLVGITGTKGKSTTAYFMKYILDDYMEAQHKKSTAILSSIDNYDGVIDEESHLTTAEAIQLHKHFDNAVKSNIEYLSMEVSSQALKYHRTLGVKFDVGCFLNIGQDHISDVEHPDFKDYFLSKLLLFKQCKTAVVNLNSNYIKDILRAAKDGAERVITYGTQKDADIYGYDVKVTEQGISFKVKSDSFDRDFFISIRGLFNVENALAAIASAYALNIPLEFIESGLRKARVSGRMEYYTSAEKKVNVIVDYAHNKMSFEALFSSVNKEFPGKKISIVFGCPGNKAFGRRTELAEVAGKYSQNVYITEEDAGEEPVMKICKEISTNIEKYNCAYEIIPDRTDAIKAAINDADENTVVLITGKGRETRQKRGTNYIDTPSDVDCVKSFLNIK